MRMPVSSETSAELAVDLSDVRKVYRGEVEALRSISMDARRGEVFGLLGPNGAGKSTLVKIMLTVVRATRANGTILGAPVGDKSVLSKVGYLPEKHRFPEYLTGRQAVEFSGAMCNVARTVRRRRAAELLDLVGMTDWADRKVSTYSKGMMQRIGIAAAMVNDPELVVLDEPTDGVDPIGRRDIRDVLIRIREQGVCVFLNSHLLSELEMVCDRVAILIQGKVATQGTIDELTAESRRYKVVFRGAPPAWCEEDGLRVDASGEGRSTLIAPQVEVEGLQPIIDRLRRENIEIVSVEPIRESLEDLFMRYVRDPLTGRAVMPGALRKNPPVGSGGNP